VIVPSGSDEADPLKLLLEGLRQLGYEEGRNLVLERRSAEGKRERYLEIAAELVRLKTDVIVTIGTFMTPPSRATTLARLMKMLPVHVPGGDRAKTAESTARIQASLCGRPARIAKPAPQMGGVRSPGARVCVIPPCPTEHS
jgi:putative ABC transport system substrate-binding protein